MVIDPCVWDEGLMPQRVLQFEGVAFKTLRISQAYAPIEDGCASGHHTLGGHAPRLRTAIFGGSRAALVCAPRCRHIHEGPAVARRRP